MAGLSNVRTIFEGSRAITDLGYRIPFTTRFEAFGREILSTTLKTVDLVVNDNFASIEKASLLPQYELYRDEFVQIFDNLEDEKLKFKSNMTTDKMKETLPKDIPHELWKLLHPFRNLTLHINKQEEKISKLLSNPYQYDCLNHSGQNLNDIMKTRVSMIDRRSLLRSLSFGAYSTLLLMFVDKQGGYEDIAMFFGACILGYFATARYDKAKYSSIINNTSSEYKTMQLLNMKTKNDAILNSLNMGVLGLEEDRLVFVNSFAASIIGDSVEHLLGKKWNNVFQYPLIGKELKDTRIESENEEFVTREGKTIPVSYVFSPLKEDNKVSGTVVSFRDISNKKQLEKKLEISQLKFKKVAELLPVGILLVDLDGNITFANRAMLDIAGLQDLSLNREIKLADFVLGQDKQRLIEDYEKIKNGENSRSSEYVLSSIDGREIIVEVRSSLLFDNDGSVWTIANTVVDVSERKRLEEKLQFEMKKFQTAFDDSPDGMVIIELHTGEYKYINKSFSEYLGYSEEDCLGNAKEMTIWEDVAERDKFVEDLKKAGQIQNAPCLLKKKDGLSTNALMSASVMKVSEEEYLVAIIRDISEFLRLQNELKESEEKFRAISSHAMDGIVLIYSDGNLAHINPAAEKMFGCLKNDVLGKPFHELLARGEDLVKAKEGWSLFQKTGEGVNIGKTIEVKAVKRDGKEIDVELAVSETTIKDQRMAIGIIRDISDRKKLEEALLEISLKNAKLIGESPAGIYTTSFDGKVVEANAALIKMLGYDSLDEIKKRDIAKEGYIDSSERVAFQELMKNNGEVNGFYSVWKMKGGDPLHVIESSMALYDKYGNVTGYEGVIQDITTRVMFEERLKELNAAKDRFFSIISHDLRSPFSGLLGLLQLILDDYEVLSDSEKKEMLSSLFTSTKMTFSLLENLLKWAGVQSGSVLFRPEAFSLNEIIDGAINVQKTAAALKNISIIENPDKKNGHVFADRMMLDTVLRNLLSNAIKFSIFDSKIIVEIKEDGEYYEIAVKDQGVGISEDAIARLFKVGEDTSTTGTNNEKGTGLGLILCKEYVEKNGGRIWVKSKVNEGTTFFFTVPKVTP